ncbi:uncharacterized protein J3D65DRAFT_667562 [Phyllosticta citribraziliensis]|uniref:Uncharacterized protein n=1 Tax=Phyllosticta citribraziliensis TaxID=989973 RepID=A0ABR1LQS7_9PEZI
MSVLIILLMLRRRRCFKSEMDTKEDDSVSDISSQPTLTPLTSPTEPSMAADDDFWRSRGTVPWPSNTYQIIEKATGRAIALVNGNVALKHVSSPHDPATHWLCVEKNGYFGFHNPISGRYLGHDGKRGISPGAAALNNWELITPREHPEGGYQIMFPFGFFSHALMVLCVAEDGKLAMRNHGTTIWEFVKVEAG